MKTGVCFRVDASAYLGQGHLMRCLALAESLRDEGWQCHFVCQEKAGHAIDGILCEDFLVHVMPDTNDWQADAEATLALLDTHAIDTLIVDHYGLDARWERQLHSHVRQLMVIDDLANREHDCDLLLDQNAGRNASDYQRLVPSNCIILAGSEFALLRKEFSEQRVKIRPRNNVLEHLLISLGGADAGNVTDKVLLVLKEHPPVNLKTITIVLGKAHTGIDAVRTRAAELPWPVRIILNAKNMAELMAEADLAIGGGGISSWERCCMGLPSLIIAIADNQLPGAMALQAIGGAQYLGDTLSFTPALRRTFERGLSAKDLSALSDNAFRLVDGNGLSRVLKMMNFANISDNTSNEARLRTMNENDLHIVLAWRNHPQVRKFMRNRHKINPAEHAHWFALKRAQNKLPYLFELNGVPVGFVQFETAGVAGTAEWGFYLAPNAPKGSGLLLGKEAIRHAFERQYLFQIVGRVMPDNLPSIRFHERLGFTHEVLPDDSGVSHEVTMLRFSLSRNDWLPNHESGNFHATYR
jgi:UDP-2,4-diacetamido-2,4,6-trideoxy-beta-L-altropyranose hydrolase